MNSKIFNLLAGSLIMFTQFIQVVLADEISHENSSVKFDGKHAGMKFEGEFKRFTGVVVLSPISRASINVKFNVESASTGDVVYDETLPESDWFDVANYPTATFKASNIVEIENGYRVTGSLNIKNNEGPIEFDLKHAGNRLQSTLQIDRLHYLIGVESDPEAEWVSQYISLHIDIPKT